MKKTTVLFAALAAFLLSSCAFVAPMPGTIYTGMKAGSFENSDVKAAKEGTACAQSVLGIVTWGDASIEAAKKEGGIKKVASVDHESFAVLVYGKYCTIIKGE